MMGQRLSIVRTRASFLCGSTISHLKRSDWWRLKRLRSVDVSRQISRLNVPVVRTLLDDRDVLLCGNHLQRLSANLYLTVRIIRTLSVCGGRLDLSALKLTKVFEEGGSP